MRTIKFWSIGRHAPGGLPVAALLLALSLPTGSAHAQTIWNAGVGNWNAPGNWSLGVPSSTSITTFDAQIKNGGTAQLSALGASVRRMRVGVNAGGGHLEVNGGGLTVTEDLILNFQGMSSATMTVQNGGIVTVPATIVGLDGNAFSTFSITGAGSRVNATASFAVAPAASGELILADSGTLAIGNGTLPLQVGAFNGSSFAILRIGNGGAAGVLQASAVQLGNFSAHVEFSHTGNLTFATPIAGPGYLLKYGPGTTTLSGTNSYSGSTTVLGGTLAISADANLGDASTSLLVNGGTVRATQDVTIAATRSLTISSAGGTIEVDATKTFTYQNSLSLSEGTMTKTGAGTLALQNLTIGASGSSALVVTGGGTLSSGSSVLGDGPNGDGSATVSGPGATWTTNDFTVGQFGKGTLEILAGGTVTTTTYGIVAIAGSGSPGTATVRGAGSTWNVGDDLTVGAGGLSGLGGGTLNIDDQALVNVGGTLTISPQNIVNLSRSTLRLNGYSRAASGTFNFNSGTIELSGSRAIGTDAAIADLFGERATITAGKGLTVEGTATILSSLTLDGGTLSVGSLVNDGEFSFLSGTLAINQAGASIDTPFVTGNPSTINVNANNISLGVATSFFGFHHQGALNVGANAVTLNSAGYARLGVLTTMSNGTISAPNGVALGSGANLRGSGAVNARVSGESGAVIEASGALAMGDAASPAGFNYSGELRTKQFAVTLRGSAAVGLGNLTTLGSGASPGTLTATNGLVVDFAEAITGFGTINSTNTLAKRAIVNGVAQGNSAAQPLTFTGYVAGVGMFNHVTFNGTLDLGLSPAIATVGSITFGPTNTLRMALGGLIVASGNLGLGGALNVTLIDGFNPVAGSTFDLFDWNTRSGTFASINLPALDGLAWNTSQLYTTGVLSVVAPGVQSADFDEDHDVDGADLTRWRTNFATGTMHLQGDADSDVDADGADFLTWQRQVGQTLAVASATPVPEPSALLLAILAGLPLLRCVADGLRYPADAA